jgi:hypothetical protein
MAPPKFLLTLTALALVTACSGEKSDEFTVSLDGGSELGEGDAGGDPLPGDGGPDHTLDAGADASQPPDAAEPGGDGGMPRSDLTILVQDGSLARCESILVDVAWQGEASFPGLTVSGLPTGVSYTLGEPSAGRVTLRVTADNRVALGQKHTVSVKLGEGASALSAEAELDVASTFRVSGRVVNSEGKPAPNAQITLNDDLVSEPRTTNEQGEFVIAGVSEPYGLFVLPGAEQQAVEYRGLTRCDPAFVSVGARTGYSAGLSGTITPPTSQTFSPTGDRLYVGGKGLEPALVSSPTDTAGSAFSFEPHWTGDSTFTGPIHAVLVRPGPVFAAVGSLDVTAPHGGLIPNLNIPLTGTLPTRAHTIRFARGAYENENALNVLSFDVGDGHFDALPVDDLPALGTLNFVDQTASLTATIPSGDTVLSAFGSSSPVSLTSLLALQLAPAATQGDTVFTFPSTAPFADTNETFDDSGSGASTFTWSAIAGADAIIVDLPGSVRAVLPGNATSYSTSTVVARGVVPSTCNGAYRISAVFLDGYDADQDADGSGRSVPREPRDFGDGAGRLLGVQSARVYTWLFYNCV